MTKTDVQTADASRNPIQMPHVTGEADDAFDLVDLEEHARGAPLPQHRRRFRLRIDGELFVIASGAPTGAELLALVAKAPAEWCLVQRVRGGRDEVIAPDERTDLLARGVERFVTRRPFALCIEGKTFPWCASSITTEQIAALGGWDIAQGVIEVDEHQNERTLAPGEVVDLRPDREYGKRHRWKRGRP